MFKRWVSYHGLALNVEDDPRAFVGLKPCGFSSEVMTNMQKQVSKLDRDQVKEILLKNLKEELSFV